MKARYSIRDLLWLTLVIGMAVAWWIDHQAHADLRGDLMEKVQTIRELQASKDLFGMRYNEQHFKIKSLESKLRELEMSTEGQKYSQ